jgi:hypothetical protein
MIAAHICLALIIGISIIVTMRACDPFSLNTETSNILKGTVER